MLTKKILVKYEKIRSIFFWFMLKATGVKIESKVYFSSGVKIYNRDKLKIGNNVFINDYFWCNAKGGVNIGNDVLIGPNVTIHSSNHNYANSGKPFRLQGHTDKQVNIGCNVWLCASVVISPGVSICDNVVVAAGSVVTKNITKSGVYGGVPAKFIKNI
ncbi:acyltransferase [Vibrio parahaemolyticus]|uniref:acyltransferase n=1 Tax=Vibrio parahaemolyticus TaxID=670 RepID=UPI0029E7066D|nr:acyltransferase [Vibrio parahaemolyticus]